MKSHQKSEGALSELSESDVQKEVELLKEQYEFLQALITLLPSPMAIVDENGFVRFLNQSASKFFDKAVAGANFAQMLKEKFEEDNFGFNLHGMSEEKSSRPRIRGRIPASEKRVAADQRNTTQCLLTFAVQRARLEFEIRHA